MVQVIIVKPQSQRSWGRRVEWAGCSFAGDGETSRTASEISSRLTGRQLDSGGYGYSRGGVLRVDSSPRAQMSVQESWQGDRV